MIIRMKVRDGFEKEPCLFPGNTYDVPGYTREHAERVEILEEYARKQIEALNLGENEPVELYAGGQDFVLVAILNAFSSMHRAVTVSYRDWETGIFHGQLLEPAEDDVPQGGAEARFLQAENRHWHPSINGLESVYPQAIPKEQLFDFQALEQMAEQKLRGTDAPVIRLYATGLSQCLVSAIKVCRKLHKGIIIMHYNSDTEEYFEQICR